MASATLVAERAPRYTPTMKFGVFYELQMPQPDFWYQSKLRTDGHGEFQFRISQPPKERTWMLYYAGKRFGIDYSQITPKTFITLTVNVGMTYEAEPEGGGPAHRTQYFLRHRGARLA